MTRLPWLFGLLCLPTGAWAQTVLWYHGNGGTLTNSTAFDTHISQTLSGTLAFEDDWSAVTLTDHRLVLIARPTTAFDSAQIADLQAFLAVDGTLVLIGDSLSGGQPQIDTLNGALVDLGYSMQLGSVAYSTDAAACTLTNVINGSDLIAPSNPLSVIHMGDIVPGSASILLGFSQTIGTTVVSSTLIVQDGRTILSADYDFFSSDSCGLTAKQSFWTSLYEYACDADGDGLLDLSCGGNDCDDSDATVGAFGGYIDEDLDGFGDDDQYLSCQAADVDIGGDCDDTDPDVNPDATELCDGVDNDCNGLDDDGDIGTDWFPDDDGDGYGEVGGTAVLACDAPSGHVESDDDCNDGSATVNPGAAEVCNNIVDDDCDGVVDEDCQGGFDTDVQKKPCGCASSAPGGAVGLLWAAALTLRRRERR